MASAKRLRKIGKEVRSRVVKRKMLGALIILAFVAFGSVLVNYYFMKAQVNPIYAAAVLIFIGGFLAVLIEMRGVLGKKISRVRKIRIRRKKKE
jgi:hypothetical protein